MRFLKSDLSVYKKFNFEKPPVGVKFLLGKPEGIAQIDKILPFCEMLKEAQLRQTPFYFSKENENCVGKVILGMEEMQPHVEGGLIGPRFGIFQDARANNKIYQYIPKFQKGIVNFVAFSTLDQLSFEPDLLILMAKPRQAEIVLRAMSYSTGELWDPKATSVLGCAWLYAHPFLSGKVNYTITGLAFGMIAKQIFEEGWMLLSIPYNWIPTITRNLQEMEWDLPSYTDGREKFLQREERVFNEAAQESRNV
jgi:uncharacterized protein (DUF169 family)